MIAGPIFFDVSWILMTFSWYFPCFCSVYLVFQHLSQPLIENSPEFHQCNKAQFCSDFFRQGFEEGYAEAKVTWQPTGQTGVLKWHAFLGESKLMQVYGDFEGFLLSKKSPTGPFLNGPRKHLSIYWARLQLTKRGPLLRSHSIFDGP